MDRHARPWPSVRARRAATASAARPAAVKSPRRSGWSQALAYPLPVKGGGELTTLSEARAFIVNEVPPDRHQRQCWQLAGRLIIHAAKSGIDIEAATLAVESALFLDYRLDLKRHAETQKARPAP